MKKVLNLALCLIFVGFLTSGCIKSDVFIEFDNHDNMKVETTIAISQHVKDFIDSTTDESDDLTENVGIKGIGISVDTQVQEIDDKDYFGTKKTEVCKKISKAKHVESLSIFEPINKESSIVNVDNYVFVKKYSFNGKVDLGKNNSSQDVDTVDIDKIISSKLKIKIPNQAIFRKANAEITDSTSKDIYVWKLSFEDIKPITLEFWLLNWFAIIALIVVVTVGIFFFVYKKGISFDWRTILKNTANGLNNLSNKDFSPQGTQTKLPVNTVTPKTELPKEEKKVTKSNKKVWLIVAIVLVICATGFYFSIPKICDILIQNSITSLYEGKAEKAIQLVEVAKTLSPKNNFANDIYSKGLEEIDKNNMTNAETFMDMALKLADDEKEEFSEELTKKSINALNKKQYSKAKRLMTYATKFDDEKPLKKKDELLQKCKNLLSAKKFEESLAYTEILALLEPKNFKHYSLKGTNLYYMKRFKESIEAYTKAININNSDSLSYLGRCDSYMSLNELDKAMYDCNKALSIGGAPQKLLGQAKYNLAIIYMEKHTYRKAMEEAWAAKDLFYNAGDNPMYIKSYQLFNTAADYECNYGTYCYY